MVENDVSQNSAPKTLLGRGDMLFALTAVAMVAGLLVPLPEMLLDAMWGLALCLSLAVLITVFSARNAAELAGFPLLVVLSIILRLAVGLSAARLIFLTGTGGRVIEKTGEAISAANPIWTIIICPVAAVVVLAVIIVCSGRITRAARRFTAEIIPLKEAGIETDLKTGVIDYNQARSLSDRIFTETSLYLNMAGVSRLMVCEAVIAALAVFVTVLGLSVMGLMNHGPNSAAVSASAVFAGGLSILVLTPPVIIAVASASLLSKKSLLVGTVPQNEKPNQGSKGFQVFTEEGTGEKVEILNPDFSKVAKAHNLDVFAEEKQAEFEQARADQQVSRPQEDKQETDDSVVPGGRESGAARIIPVGHRFASVQDYYEDIADNITTPDLRTVMLAAESVRSLPVTVAVNTAIELVKRSKKVLVVDTDIKRSAVARAFDINPGIRTGKPLETCITGLFILSLRETGEEGFAEKLAETCKGFDKVIIYRPEGGSDFSTADNLFGAEAAVIFTLKDTSDDRLYNALVNTNCPPVAVMLPPDKAVR